MIALYAMLKRLTITTIILSGLIPAVGLAASGAWPLALACGGMSGLWLAGYCKSWDALASWLLAGFVVLAALGVGAAGGRTWAPPAVVLALAAWDLHHFTSRARALGAEDRGPNLARRRLWRLMAVSGLGLALSWAAAGARLTLSFGAALALGFLAILGLSRGIRALIRETD